jgi:hypothetical protein
MAAKTKARAAKKLKALKAKKLTAKQAKAVKGGVTAPTSRRDKYCG